MGEDIGTVRKLRHEPGVQQVRDRVRLPEGERSSAEWPALLDLWGIPGEAGSLPPEKLLT